MRGLLSLPLDVLGHLGRRAAVAVCLGSLVGCASCPSFRAGWYLVPTDAPEGSPALYLALLNEGRRAVPLIRVIVNPEGGMVMPGTGLVLQRDGTSLGPLQVELRPPGPVADGDPIVADWSPGRLLLFRLQDASKDRCHLPVAVEVQCATGCRSTRPITGTLPSHLTDEWKERCQPRKETAS